MFEIKEEEERLSSQASAPTPPLVAVCGKTARPGMATEMASLKGHERVGTSPKAQGF